MLEMEMKQAELVVDFGKKKQKKNSIAHSPVKI